jgi:hypothetical protein
MSNILEPALGSKSVPSPSGDLVVLWLEELYLSLTEACAGELGHFYPDWDSANNLRFLFKYLAARIATSPALSSDVQRQLNVFVNARPLINKTGAFCYTFDFVSSRIAQWQAHLHGFIARPGLRALVVNTGEGGTLCWLLSHVFSGSGCHVFSAGHPAPISPSGVIFRSNVSCYEEHGTVIPVPGSVYGAVRDLSQQGSFDFIYFEGMRTFPDRRTAVHLLEAAVLAWRALKRGGMMMFDDCQLQNNPLTNLIFNVQVHKAIDAFLKTYEDQYTAICVGRTTVLEKL